MRLYAAWKREEKREIVDFLIIDATYGLLRCVDNACQKDIENTILHSMQSFISQVHSFRGKAYLSRQPWARLGRLGRLGLNRRAVSGRFGVLPIGRYPEL